jgi:predicted PurR-regulated permease PerM
MRSGRGVESDPAVPDQATAPARDPFVRRLAWTVAFAFLAVLGLVVLARGIGVLLAAFGGVLLAILLTAGARGIAERTPLGYGVALAVLLAAVLGVLGGAAWVLAPHVAEQADELTRVLPEMAREVEAFLGRYGWGQWLLEQVRQDGGGGMLGAVGGGVAGALSSGATYALVVLFVGLFAAAKPELYTRGLESLTPPRHRGLVAEILTELGHTLRWWLVGQGITMVLIGVSTMIVLWAFGVPLAILVGLIVGLLGFIPYLGPIFGALPVGMVAATQGADTLLWVLVAYTAVQLLEGYVAVPLVQEQTVYLPPVFTIVFQILMGVVVGVMGIVFATPLAAVLLVLSRFYRRDFLGDDDAAGDMLVVGRAT